MTGPSSDTQRQAGGSSSGAGGGSGKQPNIKLYYQQKKRRSGAGKAVSGPGDTGAAGNGAAGQGRSEAPAAGAGLEAAVNACCRAPVWPRIQEQLERLDGRQAAAVTRLLERMVEGEAERVQSHGHGQVPTQTRAIYGNTAGQVEFSAWLGNDGFLRALVAAALVYEGDVGAAEAVRAEPFDTVLVIEAVLRHAPGRTAEAMERMKAYEEELLMGGVWATDHIYTLIEEDRARTARLAAAVDSPRKALLSMTAAAESVSRVTRLELFFRKYFRLAVRTIDAVCRGLQLPDALQEAVWRAWLGMIEFVEPAHRLLQRRTLPQVMAALVYSVCRFHDLARTFRQIVAVLPADYKAIWMGEGQRPADLIAFYNQLFLPAMQQVIHALPPLAADTEADDGALAATVPQTPQRGAKRGSLQLDEYPLPALHSPVRAAHHLSKRVQLEQSPLKHSLTKNIQPAVPAGMTPTKLRLSTAADKPAVARRLDF